MDWIEVFRTRDVVGLEAEVVAADDLEVLDAERATDTLTETVDVELLNHFGMLSVKVVDIERSQHEVEEVGERLQFAILVS